MNEERTREIIRSTAIVVLGGLLFVMIGVALSGCAPARAVLDCALEPRCMR